MKHFNQVAIIAIALVLCCVSVQADPVLRGYWTFDDNTVTDTSGYKAAGTHNGTLVGSGVNYYDISTEPGNHVASGNYISFTGNSYAVIDNTGSLIDDGTGKRVNNPNYIDTYDLNGGSFTISTWVKGLPEEWRPYVSKNGEANGYQVRRRTTENNPTFTMRNTGGTDDPTVNIAGVDSNLNDGEWHNLIAVYGGTYRELYMDGQLVSRITDTATNPGGTGEFLVFSARDEAGKMTAFSNISLDNVAFYAGALRNNQISYINDGGDPQNLVAVQAETINISMTSPNNKGVKTSFSGKTTHSFFDGVTSFEGGYLDTNLPVGSAGLNGSFTASAWVKLDSTSGDQPIFGNSTEAKNAGLHLIVRNGQPLMGFYENDLTASKTLNTDEWYYLTFQYDASTKEQSIYLNGEEIATRTATSNFIGGNTLNIGSCFNGSRRYLDGTLKGVAITDGVLSADDIKSQMNTTSTIRFEDFSMGKNTAEWAGSCGATFGNAVNDYGGKSCLMTFWSPKDGTTSTIYGDGDSDNKTGAVWGPQFTVANSLPDNAKITFKVAGSSTALKDSGHTNGGTGVALWDITKGDFVRKADGSILSYTGNSTATWFDGSFSLNGLEGHNVMLVAMDRQAASYGWIAITDVTADATQISPIANSVQNTLALTSFNFDTAGSFDGMYEVDAAGNRLETITNFSNGTRCDPNNTGYCTNFYIDQSGTISAGKKGFLSSGNSTSEETPTGTLRSDNFLVQGDVLEFYIAGGNNINNKHIDLVDADTGQVYFSATGDNSNDFHYDMWNLKDIQGKSVYIKIVDADGGTSWSHLEIDQIQQTKFAPTAAWVNATTNNKAKSGKIEFNTNLPGINAESYALEGTGITNLDQLENYIKTGAVPTDTFYRHALGDWGGFYAGKNVGVDVHSTLNVDAGGVYTFALVNDEACRLMLNGEKIFETDGSSVMEFIPFTLTQTGQYALDMLYLENTGKGVALYVAEGAYDSWNPAVFSLLSGFGDGHLLSYGSYFVGSNFVPEPSTWALMILGFAGLIWYRRFRGEKRVAKSENA